MPPTSFRLWWEEHPEAVHALAALFRIKNTTNLPLPSIEWNIPVDQNVTTLEAKISWQDQSADPLLTRSQQGEQVWFVKGETLGVVLIELDQNRPGNQFAYQAQQAGQPTPTDLPAAIGTGRILFSHWLATSQYQPHTAVEIAGVGPLGERTVYVDGARAGATDFTNIAITITGTVTSDMVTAGGAQLNMVSASGGAWQPNGQPGVGDTGGLGFINLVPGTGLTYNFVFSASGDDLTFFVTGVDGNVLDGGFGIVYTGNCATWKHIPASGFWRKVSDYQNVLVAGVNFTLRNPNNDLAVPSATDILVAKLRDPYHGWFIRQAMFGGSAFNFISENFNTNQFRAGIYGKGLTVALLPLDTPAYNSFTSMAVGSPDGSNGITDVKYNLEGGGPGGALRMEEACIVVNCTIVANATTNQGCNATRECTVRWVFYGNDPTDQARKATMNPDIYRLVNFYAGFYPVYERLDENAELPTIEDLLKILEDAFKVNYVAPPDLLGVLDNKFDGGGQEEKVGQARSKKVRVTPSRVDLAKALLEGRKNA